MSITHAYVTTHADPDDSSIIGASKWNADHVDSQSVTAYGAVGDGVTDDTTSIQDALNANAGVNGVYLPPGTYLIGDDLVLPSDSMLYGIRGLSIIKKSDDFDNPGGCALTVSGDNVTLRDFELDGNRSGGALSGGIMWTGSNGYMADVYVHSHKQSGIYVNHASATLDCWRVTSNDNVYAVVPAADGFTCVLGVMRLHDCIAVGNDYYGFHVDVTAADGCYLDGRADDNQLGGCRVASANGKVGSIVGTGNHYYGFLAESAVNWQVGTLNTYATGDSPTWGQEPSGAGLELMNASHCSFGTVISHANGGYGVAVAQGSSHNSFGSILVDNTGSFDGDPGFHLSGGASYNSVGHLHVVSESYAVVIGEGISPGTNDYNYIDSLYAEACEYGVVRIDAGSYNHFDTVISRDCYTTAAPGSVYVAILNFTTSDTAYNVVRFLDHSCTGTEPYALIRNDGSANHNYVLAGFSRDYSGAAIEDYGASNSFTLGL